ncbi:MAG: hypothetical protein HY551_03700, partial [Elusimicrobia bacterium]|nr:hypothetical protein [Elusimicrobiota bacterium]
MCLGFGLAGLCIVLTALIDSLFSDWDVVSDVRLVFRHPSLLARGLRRQASEDLDSRAPLLVTRLQMHERRFD